MIVDAPGLSDEDEERVGSFEQGSSLGEATAFIKMVSSSSGKAPAHITIIIN
jgi:hypothetical protein